MINERSSEALAFNGVINCGSESPFHHRARHCRNISARPRDALQRSLEGLTRRRKKIAVADLHAIEANSARADRCPPSQPVRRRLVDSGPLKCYEGLVDRVPAW